MAHERSNYDVVNVKDDESKPALEVLKWGIDKYYQRIAIASSFSIEDTIVIDIATKREPAIKASLGEKIFKRGWGWLPTGIVIGLVGTLAFYTSTLAGRSYPLGITAGWIQWIKMGLPAVDASVNWIAWLVIGIIVGALVAALIAGELKFRMPSWGMILQTFIGGLLMGFGAVCSGGCNVTHILSGVPQLAISSLVATVAIVLGAWLTAYLVFIRPQTTS